MTIYETIKAAVPIKQAAEHYGLKANRSGMACCPFHHDRHPSLKLNEDYFFCFGCGAKGDVIDLVARLFDLSGYEAAQRLVSDFGISTEPGQAAAASCKPKHLHIRQFREDEMMCFRVLTDYLHLLEDWKVRYSPKTPDALRVPAETQQSGFGGKRTSSEMSELSPQGGSEGYGACEDVDDRFVEACQMLDYIEYLADILTVGDLEERVALVDELMKDGKIAFLKEYTARKKKEVAHRGEEPENA